MPWSPALLLNLQIFVSRPDGGDRIAVSGPDERCFNPILSPDSHRVCHGCLEHGGSIGVARVDGTQRVNLEYGSNPSWSPDAHRLVYEVTRDDGVTIVASDLYIVAYDGTGRVRLTDTPDLIERWPAWSPDGTQIAFSAEGDIYTLFIRESVRSRE